MCEILAWCWWGLGGLLMIHVLGLRAWMLMQFSDEAVGAWAFAERVMGFELKVLQRGQHLSQLPVASLLCSL
jgi:hypothetical protein